MLFGKLFPPGYERTCRSCGYVWALSRRQAKFRPRRPSVRPRMYLAPYAGEATFTEQLQLHDQFAHCAVCGSHKFSQRRLPTFQEPR